MSVSRLGPSSPLPPYAYVPGRAPHPTRDPRGHSYGLDDVRFGPPPDDATWQECAPWLYVIDLFNHGYYWEAHEGFEAWWRATPSTDPRHALFQGLVKLAAAGVKTLEQQPGGVRKHAAGAERCLVAARDRGASVLLGLDLDVLATAARDLPDTSTRPELVLHLSRAREVRSFDGTRSMRATVEPNGAARFWSGVEEAERFFMADDRVHHALRKLTGILDEAGIAYAIAGGMALNQHGYRRVTVDVDVLLTADGLQALKSRVLGRGYLEKFPGSRGLRDTVNGVDIDVLLTGDFPGDGNSKSVAFPDPEVVRERGSSGSFLPLRNLVELKLASGLSAPHRLRDLADVLELIRAAGVPRELACELDESVREKYDELWQAAQIVDPE